MELAQKVYRFKIIIEPNPERMATKCFIFIDTVTFESSSSCTEDVQLSIEKAAVSSFLDPACER